MEKNPLSTTVPTTIAKRHLPALLQFASGEAVISPWQWPARHAEILELFRAQVFGRNPVERPAALQFRLESSVPNALGGAATLKRVAIEFSGTYGSGKITLSLYVPNSRAGAAPTFLLISHRDSHRGAVLAEPETQAQLDNDPF